jgi:enoyl-CoA hydratase
MGNIDIESYKHVRLTQDGAVLTATLSNPGKKNAINRGMQFDLDRLWRDVDNDDSIGVVVLTGEGNAFCAGIDLSLLSDGDVEPVSAKWSRRSVRSRMYDMIDCETPIIAKVRGPAFGLGVNIALTADFVIATDDARLCDSHVKHGLTAGDGGVLIALMVGFRRAKELLMLGQEISGKEAAEIGLITKSVPEAELDDVVADYARRITEVAPLALSWTKLSLNTMLKQLSLGGFETSVAYDLFSVKTEDVKEGATAFMEKRKPQWKGR